jgi:hypothetical protein
MRERGMRWTGFPGQSMIGLDVHFANPTPVYLGVDKM